MGAAIKAIWKEAPERDTDELLVRTKGRGEGHV